MSRDRRRGRSLVTLVVVAVIVVLIGVAIGADRLALRQAEATVAENLQNRAGLATAPDVTIHGFPFLTQLAAGRFDQIDLDAAGVPAGTEERPLLVDRMVVRLLGVETSDSFQQVSAADLDGTAYVTWPEIGRQVGTQVVPEENGRIRVDVAAGVYGQQVPIVVSARPVLDVATQQVRLSEPRALVGGYQIPPAVVERVAGESVRPVELRLPLSLQATDLIVGASHLELGLHGTDVPLAD